jgi:hypothetical protein
MAEAAECAAVPFEVQRGGVVEHDAEIVEQMAPSGKQRLLDQVLGGACCEPSAALIGKVLAEPRHGAVEMVQIEFLRAGDRIGVAPARGGAIRARVDEAMQHGQEDRPLQRKTEAARGRERFDHGRTTGLLPEPFEDQRRAEASRGENLSLAAFERAQDERLLAEAGARAQQAL